MAIDPVGLVIIRAWLEPRSPSPLRVELRATTDISSGFQRRLILSEVEGVCEAVGKWLAEMLANEPPEGPPARWGESGLAP